MGRKHCGKRRNCSLRAISPFPTVFSKGFFPRGVKNVILWEWVNPVKPSPNFQLPLGRNLFKQFPKQQVLEVSKLKELYLIISNLMNVVEFPRKGRKRCGRREKLLDISFSHSAFKRLILLTHENKDLFGIGLKHGIRRKEKILLFPECFAAFPNAFFFLV